MEACRSKIFRFVQQYSLPTWYCGVSLAFVNKGPQGRRREPEIQRNGHFDQLISGINIGLNAI